MFVVTELLLVGCATTPALTYADEPTANVSASATDGSAPDVLAVGDAKAAPLILDAAPIGCPDKEPPKVTKCLGAVPCVADSAQTCAENRTACQQCVVSKPVCCVSNNSNGNGNGNGGNGSVTCAALPTDC